MIEWKMNFSEPFELDPTALTNYASNNGAKVGEIIPEPDIIIKPVVVKDPIFAPPIVAPGNPNQGRPMLPIVAPGDPNQGRVGFPTPIVAPGDPNQGRFAVMPPNPSTERPADGFLNTNTGRASLFNFNNVRTAVKYSVLAGVALTLYSIWRS